MKKLQYLKVKIKEWNKEVFGRIEASRFSISKELEEWDLIEKDRG